MKRKTELSLGKAIELYWEVEGKYKKSRTSCRIMLNHISKFLGEKKIHKVTTYDVQDYQRWREGHGVRPTTVNRETSLMIRFFNKMDELLLLGSIRCKLPEDNPASPKLNQLRKLVRKVDERDYQRSIVITPEQLDHLMEFADGELARMMKWAFVTGMRLKDIRCLSPDNVNIFAGTIEFIQNKTQKKCVIPLTPMLQSVISESSSGRIFKCRNFRRRFHKMRTMAGYPTLQFKDLRRSCGTFLLESGQNAKTIQERLGHASLLMTERYLRPSKATAINAGLAIEKAVTATPDIRQLDTILDE